MTFSNRPSKQRSDFNYNPLEPRQLLAADLSNATIPTASYFLEDLRQESVAREFLANNPDTAVLNEGDYQLELVEIKRGLATTVTRFQQTILGVPVVDAYVTTIQGRQGDFNLVHNQSFQGDIVKSDAVDLIDFEVTEQLALDHAGATSTFAPSRGELVFLPGQNKTATQVWQMTVFGVTPETHGDFLTFIDAETGRVLSQENRIANATGTGNVFYPNPYQTLGSGTGITDGNDADSPELTNQLISVTLEGLNELTGFLVGEFADLQSLNSTSLPDNDANEPTKIYEYTRDDDRFEQVVIYHTVDQLNRYFHVLGFDDDTGVANGIRDFPTRANAHWYGDDQSFYSTGDDAIHFGDGGVDDGEDGDIIAHEYGHAIQHDQNASWGGGEMGAMGEGFGDYLAASFFQTHGDATFQASHAAAVGEWDATSYSSDNPPNLRRVDGTKMYPGDLTGQVHADGEIWSRALWDMNQTLGAAVADQLILESHFMLPAGSSMVTAAEMILMADQNLNGGANETAIRAAFEARGILEAPATIGTVTLDKSVYSVGDVISITVVDGNGPFSIPITITSSNGDSESLTLTGTGFYEGTITSAEGTATPGDGLLQGAIGDTFTVTYEDLDDGMGNPVTASDSAQFANVKQYNSTDTPISITDNNSIQSTITVADVGDLADIDLQLNITHTYDGDLTGVLTAPNGEQITLFARIGGGGDNYDDTLFDDDATQSITAGAPPFSGVFQPTESFAALDGISITGDWVLTITDSAAADTGTLNTWSMFIVANPKPPAGTLTIDMEAYEVGDMISIEVGDGNGPAMIPVTVTSSNGDSETLMLTGNLGLYNGTLNSVAGSPTADDGQLQAAVGDTFTVTYLDTDDGTGNPLTASDSGVFAEVTEYTAGDVPIDITDNNTISSTITIADSGTLLDVDLQLNITHTYDGDLTGVLTAPNGEEITLFARIGGSGDNYEDTRFDDEASQLITSGSAPFVGVFSPEESFSILDGISITGDWVLSITDSAGADTGTLNSWSLFIQRIENNPGDALEQNDGFQQATDLGTIGTTGYTDLSIHNQSDVDFFRFNAQDSTHVQIDLGFVHDAGNLDFVVYDSNQQEIARADSINDNESLMIPVDQDELYFVEVFGLNGAINDYTFAIDVPLLIAESGYIGYVEESWRTVTLANDFDQPVVIVSTPGYNYAAPVTVEINNVTANSFDVRLHNWDVNDSVHKGEELSFLVVEAGTHTLRDGTKFVAGNSQINDTTWSDITFGESFDSTPVVFTQLNHNQGGALTSRLTGIDANGFSVLLQGAEATEPENLVVDAHWLAIEAGTGTSENGLFEVGNTGEQVTDRISVFGFDGDFATQPSLILTAQTANELDASNVRFYKGTHEISAIYIEEETSLDSEVQHVAEDVGYFAFLVDNVFYAMEPQSSSSGFAAYMSNDGSEDSFDALAKSSLTVTSNSKIPLLVGSIGESISLKSDFGIESGESLKKRSEPVQSRVVDPSQKADLSLVSDSASNLNFDAKDQTDIMSVDRSDRKSNSSVDDVFEKFSSLLDLF